MEDMPGIATSRNATLACWLTGLTTGAALSPAAWNHLTAVPDAPIAVAELSRARRFGEALHFFFYDTPKVLLLLTGVVFVEGVAQNLFSPRRRERGHGSPAGAKASATCWRPHSASSHRSVHARRCHGSSVFSPPACRSVSPLPS